MMLSIYDSVQRFAAMFYGRITGSAGMAIVEKVM